MEHLNSLTPRSILRIFITNFPRHKYTYIYNTIRFQFTHLQIIHTSRSISKVLQQIFHANTYTYNLINTIITITINSPTYHEITNLNLHNTQRYKFTRHILRILEQISHEQEYTRSIQCNDHSFIARTINPPRNNSQISICNTHKFLDSNRVVRS